MGVDRNWLTNLIHAELVSADAGPGEGHATACRLAQVLMTECDISPRVRQAAATPEDVQAAAERGFRGEAGR